MNWSLSVVNYWQVNLFKLWTTSIAFVPLRFHHRDSVQEELCASCVEMEETYLLVFFFFVSFYCFKTVILTPTYAPVLSLSNFLKIIW